MIDMSCRATFRINAAVQGGGGDEKINARKDSGDGGRDDRGRRVASGDLGGNRKREKEEKAYLPDFVLKAKTVLVVIMPDAGEPIDGPSANRKVQEEVEKALLKWGRYRLALDKYTADLVISVRRGTGKAANPIINGGPVDTRPGTIETTAIRYGSVRNKNVLRICRGREPRQSQRMQGWKLEQKTTPSWCFKEEDCSTLWITRRCGGILRRMA